MSCCGKKREAMQQRRTMSVIPKPGPMASTPARRPVVFRGAGDYLVAGPHSKKVYHFSAKNPELLVDEKDAAALLMTGLFRPAPL